MMSNPSQIIFLCVYCNRSQKTSLHVENSWTVMLLNSCVVLFVLQTLWHHLWSITVQWHTEKCNLFVKYNYSQDCPHWKNICLQKYSALENKFDSAMPTCQPPRMANFCRSQSSSSQEKKYLFFLDKWLHVLWMKVERTCLLEKLFSLTSFDVCGLKLVFHLLRAGKFASGNRL